MGFELRILCLLNLKVLHVIPSISPTAGGPSFALRNIAEALVRADAAVDVATTDDDGPGARCASQPQPTEENGVRYFRFKKQTEFYKFSLPLNRWLREHVTEYDLVHIHALFSFASSAAAHQAHHSGVPYIIRPLGVLNRWGMENRRRWIKKASFHLLEERILRCAAAVHFTSQQEESEARVLGLRVNSSVIPLGIDVDRFATLPSPELFYARFPHARDREIVLFMSRLDPKKGLDLFLPAFAQFNRDHPKSLLVIAGDGDQQFLEELRGKARELQIDREILWAGFLTGEAKLSAFAAASIFVLPSYSENFGLAAVEALAAGLPGIFSDQVAVASDILECNAGLVVPCRIPELSHALQRLLSDERLRQMSAAQARRLARERFSVEVMTRRLLSLYDTLLSRRTGLKSSEGSLAQAPVAT